MRWWQGVSLSVGLAFAPIAVVLGLEAAHGAKASADASSWPITWAADRISSYAHYRDGKFYAPTYERNTILGHPDGATIG